MQSRRRAQPKAKEPWGIFGERGSLVPFSPTWVRSCALHEEWKGDSCDFSEPKEKGMASVLLSFHQLIVFVRRRSSRHVCASRTQNHTDLACRIKGRKTTQEKKGKRTYFWHSVPLDILSYRFPWYYMEKMIWKIRIWDDVSHLHSHEYFISILQYKVILLGKQLKRKKAGFFALNCALA